MRVTSSYLNNIADSRRDIPLAKTVCTENLDRPVRTRRQDVLVARRNRYQASRSSLINWKRAVVPFGKRSRRQRDFQINDVGRNPVTILDRDNILSGLKERDVHQNQIGVGC